MASSAPRKAAKDLACADCQRRKKRCDKQSPCSNCIKHNVPCVPSSPAPPRKRRQPMKELLERLAACEERLKHCKCHQSQFPPLQPELQRPPSHEHHNHGAPPSPPASAASRDAAIANMLDYSCEDESLIKKEKSPYATATTTTRYFELTPGPGTLMGSTGGTTMRAGGT